MSSRLVHWRSKPVRLDAEQRLIRDKDAPRAHRDGHRRARCKADHGHPVAHEGFAHPKARHHEGSDSERGEEDRVLQPSQGRGGGDTEEDELRTTGWPVEGDEGGPHGRRGKQQPQRVRRHERRIEECGRHEREAGRRQPLVRPQPELPSDHVHR